MFAGAVRGAEGAASHRQMASSRRSCSAPVAVILLSRAPWGLPRTEQCPAGPLGREGAGLPRWQGAWPAQPHPCRAWTPILSSSRNRTRTWYLLPHRDSLGKFSVRLSLTKRNEPLSVLTSISQCGCAGWWVASTGCRTDVLCHLPGGMSVCKNRVGR